MTCFKIIILSFLLIPLAASAGVIEVCTGCTVNTIKKALALAEDGDTIIVKKGVYKEGNIPISKSVTIIGEYFPIIDGEGKTEIFSIQANNVKISRLHIRNVGISYLEDMAAIATYGVDGISIENNIMENAFFGIYLRETKNFLIRDNLIFGKAKEEISSGNAIHLWYCNSGIVKDNIAKHHRDGIYLEFVDSSTIRNNISENNLRYGLHFMFSNHNDYIHNTFRKNGSGVAVMFSKHITMTENTFSNNWGAASYGLLLKEITDSEVVRNNFLENTIGIYSEGASRINIKYNVFKSNGWAVKFSGSSMDNVLEKNNFLNNTFNFELSSKRNYNKIDGNYWSDYTGYDLDKDGIGDVPHRPVKLYNYVVNKVPSSLVLLRSVFIDIINFAEKVTPLFTPENLMDETPLMKEVTI